MDINRSIQSTKTNRKRGLGREGAAGADWKIQEKYPKTNARVWNEETWYQNWSAKRPRRYRRENGTIQKGLRIREITGRREKDKDIWDDAIKHLES